MEEFDRFDLVAQFDQQSETSKQLARPIAAFYRTLEAEGVEQDVAGQIAVLYARMVLGSNEE